MHFKLIIALVDDSETNRIMDAAREAGATGSTVITHARGEGLQTQRSFFGLELESQRDMLLFLVEEHLSRSILEKIDLTGDFENRKGSGIAFQIDVEDVVGISHQIEKLTNVVEQEL